MAAETLRVAWTKQAKKILAAWTSSPTIHLILKLTARRMWYFLATLAIAVMGAGLEGTSYALILLGVNVLADATKLPTYLRHLEQLLPQAQPWISEANAANVFAALIALAAASQVFRATSYLIGANFSAKLAAFVAEQMRITVFRRVFALSFGSVSSKRAGDLVDHVTQPSGYSAHAILQLNQAIASLLISVAYILLLTRISWRMTLVAVALFTPVVLIQRLSINTIRKISARIGLFNSDLIDQAVESMHSLRLIFAFGKQNEVVKRASADITRLCHTEQKRMLYAASIQPLTETAMLIAIAIFIFLTFGTGFADSSSLDLPKLIAFIAVLYRLSGRVQATSNGVTSAVVSLAQAQRLDSLLDDQQLSFERRGGKIITDLETGVEFDHVTFRYRGAETDALRNLSFSLRCGTTLALVGASGGGKSTIADLMLGLYDPSAGSVRIDGVDLREIDLGSWRQLIGTVSQETFIFNASVYENLVFGTEGATREAVVAAAKAAQADEFIRQMPEGYDTSLGQRGFRLSGGQRQRLALARAILRRPRLLILDEATSALDSESERAVQSALDQLARSTTILVIAHRLSTVVGADQILVLESGQVVESGKHAELLARNGKYQRLWALQSERS